MNCFCLWQWTNVGLIAKVTLFIRHSRLPCWEVYYNWYVFVWCMILLAHHLMSQQTTWVPCMCQPHGNRVSRWESLIILVEENHFHCFIGQVFTCISRHDMFAQCVFFSFLHYELIFSDLAFMDFSIIHLFIDLYLVVPVHLSSVVSERLFRFLTNEIFQYQVFLMWHKDRKITVEVGLKSSCLIYGW